METQQLIILLCHLCAQTPLGQTMEILIRQFQLWAGIQNSVLVDTTPCPWVPSQWLSWIRSTMCTYNIQIQHAALSIPPLCQNDVYIMEAVQELGLTNSQPKQINMYQMHLQITTLAEMIDHTGTTLLPQVLTHNRQMAPEGLWTISTSLFTWPNIHQPSIVSWHLWTKTICTLFAGALCNTKLTHPLGAWTINYQKQQHWHWHLSHTGQLLHQPTLTT